jgi:hypothetical protein
MGISRRPVFGVRLASEIKKSRPGEIIGEGFAKYPSMRNEGTLTLLFLGLLTLAPVGCSQSPGTSEEVKPSASPTVRTFVYTDHQGSSSRVQRVIAESGAETLQGETIVATGGAATTIVETASLDPSGHLLHAEIAIRLGPFALPMARAIFDRAQRTAHIEARGVVAEYSVPDDAPWAYLPLSDAEGRAVATPVTSWVALRAANGAAMVRLIRPDARSSFLGPTDQMAIPTEAGRTVVLGFDGADADAGFIHQVRIASAGVTLTCLPGLSRASSDRS